VSRVGRAVFAVLTVSARRETIGAVSATDAPMGWPMVFLELRNDGGRVTFSRDDEGRDFLDLVAGQDESLARNIDAAWRATTPRPFLLPQQSEPTVLLALESASRPLSASSMRLQKLLQAR